MFNHLIKVLNSYKSKKKAGKSKNFVYLPLMSDTNVSSKIKNESGE